MSFSQTQPSPAPLPSAGELARPLSGRRALVTGAGRGIGRAIALRLARDGADVALLARTEAELIDTAEDVEAQSVRAAIFPCDLTNDGAGAAVTETVARQLGGLEVLVNNVGGAHRVQPLDQLSERAFSLGTDLNYASVYRMMHAAAPYLFAGAPHSCVLNVVSIAAARGLEGMSYYSGAKAGVVAMSRAVAREWGRHGVRVNCLGPGWIDTALSKPLRDDEEFSTRALKEIALGRWGTAEEVADAAAFLVSDSARYITGTTLYVDGGLLA